MEIEFISVVNVTLKEKLIKMVVEETLLEIIFEKKLNLKEIIDNKLSSNLCFDVKTESFLEEDLEYVLIEVNPNKKIKASLSNN